MSNYLQLIVEIFVLNYFAGEKRLYFISAFGYVEAPLTFLALIEDEIS